MPINVKRLQKASVLFTEAFKLWSSRVSSKVDKAVASKLHSQQVDEAVKSISDALDSFFVDILSEAADRLEEASGSKSVDVSELLVDSRAAHNKLLNYVVVPFYEACGKSVVSQMLLLGADPRKPEKSKVPSKKSLSAFEWLQENGESLPPPNIFSAGDGMVNLSFSTDWPLWMRKVISGTLANIFSYQYWQDIITTTQSDIQKTIDDGVEEGRSMHEIASRIRDGELLGFEYYNNRALTIARTEAGAAMNGARKASLDKVLDEVPGLDMIPVWLSVLGATTRDTHANLDGVPQDSNGMWNLGGVYVPWPAHPSLPVGERVNCQCTVVMEFGKSREEVAGLIQSYFDRLNRQESKTLVVRRRKKFSVKYNPNQPRVSSGPQGGQWTSGFSPGVYHGKAEALDAEGNAVPGKVGTYAGIDTGDWKKKHYCSQWALQKIHKMETHAANGEWDKIKKASYKPKDPSKMLETEKEYIEAVWKAEKNLLALKTQTKVEAREKAEEKFKGEKTDALGRTVISTDKEFAQKAYYISAMHADAMGAPNSSLYSINSDGHLVKKPFVPAKEGAAVDPKAYTKAIAAAAWLGHNGELKQDINGVWQLSVDNFEQPMGGISTATKLIKAAPIKIEAQEFFTVIQEDILPNKNYAALVLDQADLPKPLKLQLGLFISHNNSDLGALRDNYESETPTISPHKQALFKSLAQTSEPTFETLPYHVQKKVSEITEATGYFALEKMLKDYPNEAVLNSSEKVALSYLKQKKKDMQSGVGQQAVLAGQKPKEPTIKAGDLSYSFTNPSDVQGGIVVSGKFKESLNKIKALGEAGDNYGILGVMAGYTAAGATDSVEYRYAKYVSDSLVKYQNLKGKTYNYDDFQEFVNGQVNLFQTAKQESQPTLLEESWGSDAAPHASTGKSVSKIGTWAVSAVNGPPASKKISVGQPLSHSKAQELQELGENSFKKLTSNKRHLVEDYTGGHYDAVNLALRKPDKVSSASTKLRAKETVAAVAEASIPLPEGSVLYRKYDSKGNKAFEVLEYMAPGQVIADAGLMSTSTDKGTWSGYVQMRITLGPGVKGLPADNFSQNAGEAEVILNANQRFTVVSVKKSATKSKIVYLDLYAEPTT